jgi:Cu/Ag efflux protein CusF
MSGRPRRVMLAALLAACWSAWAATAPGEPKDVAMRLKATGTVTAIDAAARRITVKGPGGPVNYRLDPKVDNLAQVKVGDRVKLDYVAALVLTLRRGGKEVRPQAESEAQGTTVVTKVIAADRSARTVRLKGPGGRVADFRVQDEADLVGVRPGDQVVAVLHEAVVVGLELLPK